MEVAPMVTDLEANTNSLQTTVTETVRITTDSEIPVGIATLMIPFIVRSDSAFTAHTTMGGDIVRRLVVARDIEICLSDLAMNTYPR